LIGAVLLLPIGSAVGGELKPPALPDAAVVAAAAARYPDVDVVYAQEWVGVDARVRAADDGLSGRYTTRYSMRIVSRHGVEVSSPIVATESPRQVLREIRVEVVRDGKTTRYARDDLQWITITQRSDGVVTLDGTTSQALVPGLQPGDELRVTQEYELHGVHGVPRVVLGAARTPTLASTYEVRLPADYDLVWGSAGGDFSRDRLVYSRRPDGKSTIHRWSLDADAEGIVPECRENYAVCAVVPHVATAGSDSGAGMATGRTWAEVGAAYLERIQDVFSADQAVHDAVTAAIGDAATPMEKIDRIYKFVQSRCRYLGLFEGAGGLVPIAADKVLASGFGDCKGLGTLLIAMLRDAGFTAHPVLLRTRTAGQIVADVPNMAQFNHYIAWVDTGGGGMFLDGVVDGYPAGLVPAMDGVEAALLLKPDAVGVVPIPPVAWAPGTAAYRVAGRISDAGGLDVTCALELDGNLGAQWRGALAGATPQERDRYLNWALLPKGFAVDMGVPSIAGLGQWREPLVLDADAKARGPLPGDGRSVFLPRQLTGAALDMKIVPHCGPAEDMRRFPSRAEHWEIELPPGLDLVAPDPIDVHEDGVSWQCSARQEGARLVLDRTVAFTGDSMDGDALEAARRSLAAAQKLDSGYFELRRR